MERGLEGALEKQANNEDLSSQVRERAAAHLDETRRHAAEVVEIKRMYVAPAHRRLGLAQLILAELEASAARSGFRAVVLNSGLAQPEALALYAAAGYRPATPYGLYAGSRSAVFLGKVLGTEAAEQDGPGDRREHPTWAS